MKSSLFYVMTEIKKISMKNMEKVLYLTRISMEAKLIAMMVTMTFFFDETFILYS